MKALIYQDSGKTAIEEPPTPVIKNPTDTIIKVTKITDAGKIFRPFF
jgi:alcohol dehydrogenase